MQYTIRDLVHGAKTMSRSVFGKRDEYRIKFNHEEDGLWYVDFPNWPFDHHNLLMVAGADKMCAFLSDDDMTTEVLVRPSKKRLELDGYAELVQKEHSLTGGSTYEVRNLEGFDRDIWLCPVTLFVLGHYPKYMYVKKVSAGDEPERA
ncbi:MAG: hypothetical protein IKX36_04390 [Prevotella sp.]|nr:hypothetical protein [Prevotella sp.]